MAARKGPAVSESQEDKLKDNRIFVSDKTYKLQTGDSASAARGLAFRMNVEKEDFYKRCARGLNGIIDEIRYNLIGLGQAHQEAVGMLDYILKEKSSEKMYPNGIRDAGRKGVTLEYFLKHDIALQTGLLKEEVVALRLYTTSVYKYMNDPLRNEARFANHEPCLLPVTTKFAADGIKKLRALHANDSKEVRILWRGMRNLEVADNFMEKGGTELAFMSTTTDLAVAVRYSISDHSLLFRIVVDCFMHTGADLKWLSAFPEESEVLFPPLTYLKPTGKTDNIVVERNGERVFFHVVEVTPHFKATVEPSYQLNEYLGWAASKCAN